MGGVYLIYISADIMLVALVRLLSSARVRIDMRDVEISGAFSVILDTWYRTYVVRSDPID